MERKLMRMDLNLLKALDALLEERNISRAADRLFVTPSAMSKTLHRLRDALNDPLLVRAAGGLVPTPRAEELSILLKHAFQSLETFLAPASFDPALAEGRVRIASPETFAVGVMPNLLPMLREAAPGLHIESVHLGEGYLERLAAGALDFVIYLDEEYPDDYETHSLLSSMPKIWCRSDHPITQLDVMKLEDICAYPKIAFQSPSIKLTELQSIVKTLELAGLGREVMLETSHLLVALIMLSQSDALMLAPDYLFESPMLSSGVVSRAIDHIPLFDHLRCDLCMIQHTRTANSPLHQWLGAQTIQAVNRMQFAAQPALHSITGASNLKSVKAATDAWQADIAMQPVVLGI